MVQEFKGKFQLGHGCIRIDGRINSRDAAEPEYFESRSEAERFLLEQAEEYKRVGYKIWFSNVREWSQEKRVYL